MVAPTSLSAISGPAPAIAPRTSACLPGSADHRSQAACQTKAYREFEAMLAGRLAADMLATGMDDAPGSEVQQDFFRTQLAQAIGNAIAERSGLGVAAALQEASATAAAIQQPE